MQNILMTEDQTATYDENGRDAVSLMAELRKEAQKLADRTGQTVEVYTADGIVATAVNPLA
jgi:hypothetical protein